MQISIVTRQCAISRLLSRFVLIGWLGCIAGCGGHGLPLVPVKGKVTFAGGPPPAAGTISFTPVSTKEGLPHRPGSAKFDEQGVFRVTSFKANDGLLPGNYTMRISCWMRQPSSDDPSSFERFNYVPKNFSPPQVVVDEAGGEVEVSVDVPKKK
jgi:hypothetical protein